MNREVELRLEATYAALPTMTCRGRCVYSCGSVAMTDMERRRIRDKHGIAIADKAYPGGCPALGLLGQCRVYEDRPMVCRLWGMVPSLACPYGCQPDGGMMTEAEGRNLMHEVFRLQAAQRRTG